MKALENNIDNFKELKPVCREVRTNFTANIVSDRNVTYYKSVVLNQGGKGSLEGLSKLPSEPQDIKH